MNKPLVSICMPAYNVEEYIDETINSIINQTYKNWELIIVDDGSDDNTLTVAQKYESEQIKVIPQKNKGASAARNTAFLSSVGDYVKFIDADDLINPEMVECQVKLALNNEDCLVMGQWGRFYNNDITTFKLKPEDYWQSMPSQDWLCLAWAKGQSMTQSGMFLLPRHIIEKAGLWDETLTLIDDFDFFTRVILNSKKIIFDNQSTLYYRTGNSSSLSSRTTDSAIRSAFRSIDQSTRYFLNLNTSAAALIACANTWQTFVYDIFPGYPQYVTIAEERIKEYNGSNISFPAGGYTKVLLKLIGWKACKKIKYALSNVIHRSAN